MKNEPIRFLYLQDGIRTYHEDKLYANMWKLINQFGWIHFRFLSIVVDFESKNANVSVEVEIAPMPDRSTNIYIFAFYMYNGERFYFARECISDIFDFK